MRWFSCAVLCLALASSYATIVVPYDCSYAVETLKEMALPADLQVPTPWVAAATIVPGQANDGYVEVDWMKLIDLDNNEQVVNQFHYDNTGSIPTSLGGLYNRWFTNDNHSAMTNGFIGNSLMHINVGSMPYNVSHWWLPRVWGIPGHHYALQMRVKIHGSIGIQLGCDYWADLTGVDFNFQREAWLSDWYGDTGGEFVEIISPLPEEQRVRFDNSDYGFYRDGEFFISKRMVEYLGAEVVYLNPQSTPMILDGEYYRHYTHQNTSSPQSYCFRLEIPQSTRNMYIPHNIYYHLADTTDAVSNDLGGYNFVTTATLRTPVLSISKTTAGVTLSWNSVVGAINYKIWAKPTPDDAVAWEHIYTTTARTYLCNVTDNQRFYRVTAH